MGQAQEVVVTVKGRSDTPENSVIFSLDPRRVIHELGNIDLYELGQTSSTIPCHSCCKRLPEVR